MLPNLALPGSARAYVSAVIAVGLSVIALSVYALVVDPIGFQWLLLAALTFVSGSATVKLPSIPASISISETFVFTAVLLYGPAAGTLTVALDGLVISYWIAKRRREVYRAVFNMSAPALSVWLSAHLFFFLSNVEPLVREPAPLDTILPALLIFALTYFGLNSLLIAFAISGETGVAPLIIWREHFLWLCLNYLCGASVAVLIVFYTRQVDIRYIGVILPLLVVLYFTFKISMDRVADAKQHVDKINGLYLSTIETLAMAVDAKDQITHGHIRRVQRYAVCLAHELGVRDPTLLKAVEAAALLHDMGKLAIPEHILNKPGKLSSAEFNKMKLHSSIGADILSAIEFPYPVVPIVRHHHECWDGTGYPNGLKATDIPIGARILAVVDCFDALTSDRPYRRRLSADDALQILRDRRGSMYDPLVVDTFMSVYHTISPMVETDIVSESSQIAISRSTLATLNSIGSTSPRELGSETSSAIESLCDNLLHRLRSSLNICFVYDPGSDTLMARYATGTFVPHVIGMRVPVGQQLSGWVAAHRTSISNSDPSLDLGASVRLFSPPLLSATSVPILFEETLLGVLSTYSSRMDPVSERDVALLESSARQVADILSGSIAS